MAADSGNVRAVERALSILDCFTSGKTSFSLTELARELDLSLSTTLRILGTLEHHDYISRSPEDGRYYLGFRLAHIGNIALANMDVCRLSQPSLRKLRDQFGESAGVYLRRGDTRVCVTRLDGTQPLRCVLMIGNTLPLTRGAAGRVLLAHMPEQDIDRLLKQDPFTSREELARVREAGYARSLGERDPGVESVAAPIYNAEGTAFAAVFVTGPKGRFSDELTGELIEAVKQAGREISIQMGGGCFDGSSGINF